jgi:hypothetical protein
LTKLVDSLGCLFHKPGRLSSTRLGDRLAEALVTRTHTPRPLATRNRLSDFDTLVERAIAAGEEGRDPAAFVDDAARLARQLAAPCTGEDCGSRFLEGARMMARKDRAEEIVRRNLAAALSSSSLERTEALAHAAKSFIRRVSCVCTKAEYSRSGRPVF